MFISQIAPYLYKQYMMYYISKKFQVHGREGLVGRGGDNKTVKKSKVKYLR